MALSYRIPSLFCEPTSVCSVCVCAFVYSIWRHTTHTQHYRGSSMAEQNNRKPPFTLLSFLLSCDTPPTTIPTKLPWKAEKTHQTDLIYPRANISRHMWSSEQNHCSAFQVTGPRHSPEDWGGQIPFHLSDQYVPYLAGCNGTQLGWNEYELIN